MLSGAISRRHEGSWLATYLESGGARYLPFCSQERCLNGSQNSCRSGMNRWTIVEIGTTHLPDGETEGGGLVPRYLHPTGGHFMPVDMPLLEGKLGLA